MRRALSAAFAAGVAALACGGPEAPTVDPAARVLGINFPAWWRGTIGSPEADAALAAAARARVTHVAFVWTGYQSRADTFDLADDPQATPSADEVRRSAAVAAGLGLRVAVKPHVDLRDDPTRWRGQIGRTFGAAEWDRWFDGYRAWLVPLAVLAREIGAEAFFAGTELAEASRQPARWAALVAELRTVFPGQILYDANWSGEVDRLDFAPYDRVSVSAYWPLADRCDASPADLAAGWGRVLGSLEGLARRHGKPVLVAEVGYQSVDCAATRPWDYHLADSGAVDEGEQEAAYRAVVAGLGEPWLEGVYIWHWHPDPAAAGERYARDYPPQGKLAERVFDDR